MMLRETVVGYFVFLGSKNQSGSLAKSEPFSGGSSSMDSGLLVLVFEGKSKQTIGVIGDPSEKPRKA